MTLADYWARKIPEPYPYMYLDGYSPEEILYSVRRQMIQQYEDCQKVDEVKISSEVKVK